MAAVHLPGGPGTGVVEALEIPAAGGNLGDRLTALQQELPELLRRHQVRPPWARRQTAPHPHHRDRFCRKQAPLVAGLLGQQGQLEGG